MEDTLVSNELLNAENMQGGKFLTFALADETYAVEILTVREIISILDITVVPQTQSYVKGVINLRGKVIPVIDLRTKFGLPPQEFTDHSCIIVVDVGVMMGIIVDTVEEVYDIDDEMIEPPPELGMTVDSQFIMGMGKVGDSVTILLDIDQVLNSDEFVC